MEPNNFLIRLRAAFFKIWPDATDDNYHDWLAACGTDEATLDNVSPERKLDGFEDLEETG